MMIFENDRFTLSPWTEADRDDVRALYANVQATRDYGRTLTRDEADETLGRYMACYAAHGFCRWAVKANDDTLLGTTGIQRLDDHQCLGPHDENWLALASARLEARYCNRSCASVYGTL